MSNQQSHQDHNQTTNTGHSTAKKKRLIDKVCPYKILEVIPESQAYQEMFAFERKLDLNINRMTLDIQEALRRPARIKKTLRIFLSNLFYTHQDTNAPSWELRIEGRLAEDTRLTKRKFSSFFKSLTIELDDSIYGPDNHLIEWIRTPNLQAETDGFQLRRPGDKSVKCTILLQLEHQPRYFRLDKRLAKLLGKKSDTRIGIILSIWHYIKNKSLQDSNDREYINNDRQLKQIFECKRMKYSDIPVKLNSLLYPPEPIVIHHTIVRGIGETQRSIYEIDVEIQDTNSTACSITATNLANNYNNLSNYNTYSYSNMSNNLSSMSSHQNALAGSTSSLHPNTTTNLASSSSTGTTSLNTPNSSSSSSSSNTTTTTTTSNNINNRLTDSFIMSSANTQQLQQLDEKMCDTLEAIKLTRNTYDLFTSFANDPYQFTNRWLASQASNDLIDTAPITTSNSTSTSNSITTTNNTNCVNDNINNNSQNNNDTANGFDFAEEEQRRAEYYYQPWLQEAVCKYFYRKIQERRGDLDYLADRQTP